MNKCAIDLVEITRLRQFVSNSTPQQLQTIFSEEEWHYCHQKKDPFQSLAARFAAKEACLKLFPRENNLKQLDFADFAVTLDTYGAPFIKMHARLQKIMTGYHTTRIHISLSHSAEYACAIALLE